MRQLTKSVSKYAGNDDVAAWFERAKVVADVAKEDLCVAMPLLLEGKAYDVWSNLDKESKKDLKEVEKALRVVFGITKIDAFEKLREIKYKNGDNVNELLVEIKKLCGVAGIGKDESLLKSFFITSFSTVIKKQLQTMVNIEELSLSQIVDKLRTLAEKSELPEICVPIRKVANNRVIICYKCHKKGHMAYQCQNNLNENGEQ